jgi:NAD(P)-dependent dehydrogenase (short-subunit alcohol dehydrogenase family)
MSDTGSYTLDGRRVLVTGASSGIGAAVARELASAGAVVGICARRAERLEEVLADCRRHSAASRMWVTDLSRLEDVEPFARQASEELGGIDVLVNNAGIPKRRHVRELTAEVVDEVMAINFLSPMRLMLALLPGMLEQDEGRVVNVSSIAARLSPPRETAYAASKAALTTWTESMAVDLHDTGVRLHLVFPGVIETELYDQPDNDSTLSDLEALPAADLAVAMRRQLEDGRFELYFPEWFGNIAVGKAADVATFLSGSATWTAERERSIARSGSEGGT